ncbi:MAG: cohesin domain-containing protein [Monoglobaceae bacterium]
MKTKNKKILSFILALTMMLTLLRSVSFALNGNCTFFAENTESVSGGLVEVPICVKNNPGIMGFLITLTYDENVLTPVEVKSGDAFSEGGIESNIKRIIPGELRTVGYSAKESVNDGVLFFVVFEVSPTASGNYSIGISYDSSNTYNGDLEDITAECVNGTIEINGSASDNTVIYSDGIEASAGDTIDLPIKIRNLKENTAFIIKMKVDPEAIEFVSATSDHAKIDVSGDNGVYLFSVSEIDSLTDNDTLFTVGFKLNIAGNFSLILESETDNFIGKGCYITVKENTSSKPCFWVENVIGTIGQTVSISVSIKNNPGIMGFRLNMKYDPEAMIPIVESDKSGNVISGNGSIYNNISKKASTGNISFIWYGNKEILSNGELFRFEFELKKTGTHMVELSYSKQDTFNESWEELDFDCSNYSVVCENEKTIFPIDNSGTVIDYEKKIIFGLDPGINDINSYISSADGYTLENGSRIGTSAEIRVMSSESIKDIFTIVIFGDVNGDGWYDGQDAVTVSMIAGGMLTREQVGEAVWMAADCNHDGVIDQADVDLLNQAGVLLSSVDQTKSTDELIETSAEYVEYLNLIDQQTDTDSDEAPEDNTEDNEYPTELSLWNIIVNYFIALIKKIASVIMAF